MFILKKGHQPGVYVPLGALFLVNNILFCVGIVFFFSYIKISTKMEKNLLLLHIVLSYQVLEYSKITLSKKHSDTGLKLEKIFSLLHKLLQKYLQLLNHDIYGHQPAETYYDTVSQHKLFRD